MKKRLELSDGSAHEFWEVDVADATLTVVCGRIGTAGQATSSTCGSADEALQQAAQLVAEKRAHGYADPAAAPAAPAASVAPAVSVGSLDGALPKVKPSKHVRLVGSWGAFVPPGRDTVVVRAIKLSADGRLAVLALRGNSPAECGAAVHRVDTGERIALLGDTHGAVAITPDGARVYTTHLGDEGGPVQIGTCWEVATGAVRWTRTLQRGDGMPGLAISPAGELLVSSQGYGIKAYDLEGTPRWEDKIAKGGFDNHAAAIAFGPEGALTTAGADGVIRIWAGKTVIKKLTEGNPIADLAWLPGGTRLVSHSSHLTAIWDVATGVPLKKMREWDRGRTASELAISPLGRIIGCTTDGKIDIWDLEGSPIDRVDLKGKLGAWCVAACPGGFVVGTGGACALRFELTP